MKPGWEFWNWATHVDAPHVFAAGILPNLSEGQCAWAIFWVALCAWVSLEVAAFVEEYQITYEEDDDDEPPAVP